MLKNRLKRGPWTLFYWRIFCVEYLVILNGTSSFPQPDVCFTLVESDIYKMRSGGASLHSTGYTSWNLFDLSIANLCPSLLSRHWYVLNTYDLWWFPYYYLDCHLPPLMFVVLLVFVSCLQSSRFKFVYRCTTCTWRCDDVMQCRRFLVRAFAMYWQQCPNCARETTCLEWTIYWFDGLNRLMYGPEWFVDFVLTFW